MIAAIIQARTGSTRLPNKVFKTLCGQALIWHVANRLKWSEKIEKIILATTNNSNDDILENWANENEVACYRGSENDVLARYYHAAKKYNATTIVRVTADDPFKDPFIIDEVISMFQKSDLEFAYNNNPPSFPEGLDTEVFTFNALENAYHNSTDPYEREHVTQYFYRNRDQFKQSNYQYNENISSLRWTIDTQQDWDMTAQVYDKLYVPGKIFCMDEILELLRKEPEIGLINASVKRSDMYKK